MDMDIKKLSGLFRTLLMESLSSPGVAQMLWQNTNARDQHLSHDVWQPLNIRDELFRLVAQDSARFIEETIVSDRLGNTNNLYNRDFPTPYALLDESIKQSVPGGLYLEFGVFQARTTNHIASRLDCELHGFDSFEGLAETSGIWGKGGFTMGGAFPEVLPNIRLHKGWFDQTLEPFLSEHEEPVSFVHIDSDTCESARYVLKTLGSRIQAGTVIQFDEYFNYPGWREGEHKAFCEFVAERRARFRFIGYAERANCLSLAIETIDPA